MEPKAKIVLGSPKKKKTQDWSVGPNRISQGDQWQGIVDILFHHSMFVCTLLANLVSVCLKKNKVSLNHVYSRNDRDSVSHDFK